MSNGLTPSISGALSLYWRALLTWVSIQQRLLKPTSVPSTTETTISQLNRTHAVLRHCAALVFDRRSASTSAVRGSQMRQTVEYVVPTCSSHGWLSSSQPPFRPSNSALKPFQYFFSPVVRPLGVVWTRRVKQRPDAPLANCSEIGAILLKDEVPRLPACAVTLPRSEPRRHGQPD